MSFFEYLQKQTELNNVNLPRETKAFVEENPTLFLEISSDLIRVWETREDCEDSSELVFVKRFVLVHLGTHY